MYVDPNFKTKKALKEHLATGKSVIVYAPGLGSIPNNGEVDLEGPHYPKAHTWYCTGIMLAGRLVRVR